MNKLIVVTGGSRGIGKGIILKFAGAGFDIATTSRSSSDLAALEAEIKELHPFCSFYYMPSDLSDKVQVKRFVNFVLSYERDIEVIVNNSGLYIPGMIHAEEESNLELMLHTNLLSAYYLTRGLLPSMMKGQRGHIFNMCSVASITPYVNGGSYCVSKFALLGMGKVLREEMKPFGIKVTNVLPGATKTDSWDGVDLPEERFIKVSDIADIVYSAYALSASAVVEDIVIRPLPGDI